MKVLHLSDYALPDWRIEKSAISALNRNYQVFFAGLPSYTSSSVFSKIYEISWTPRARRAFPYYWYCVKKQLKKIVREARPDIVHAHNIFSAKMVSEIDIPFVYDDHEYWPSYVRRQIESYNSSLEQSSRNNDNHRRILQKTILRLLNYRFLKLGLRWEKQIVSSTPTITVSENIATELRELGSNSKVFITPNFPMKNEINDIQPPKFHRELISVYAGIESKNNTKIAHRNMEGFVDIFNRYDDVGTLTMIGVEEPSNNATSPSGPSTSRVVYKGYLPRHMMYQEMQNSSVGIVPFRKHWSHKYISPNKAYEYAHAGLVVLCTSSLVPIKNILGDYCMTFEDYGDMISQLRDCRDNMEKIYEKRLDVYQFAKENLLWESYEQNIFDAYRAV
ncbi:MAG: glycosyltransferase [Nitrososphaeraceae archaeon]